jgi:hypothetical protein
MPVRINQARAFLTGGATDGEARPDNRLELLDQAFFAGHRAAGHNEVMQVVWIYEHPVDFDALKRLHHNFGYGLMGRRIERSPLPFGRHRWISDRGPAQIDVEERARPRAEVSDWADERTQLPTDPEAGPAWHLGVLPLTDGSTAISLVMSHYVLDGFGGAFALIEALLGNTRELGYPPPRSRTRLRALAQDAAQAAREMPDVARAVVAAAKLARGARQDGPPAPTSRPAGRGGDETVVLPGIPFYIDLAAWDACAQRLGGTGNTLAAALTAKLGERIGRRHDDGKVTVQLAMSDRSPTDTRAIAVQFASATVDPAHVTTDLSGARAAVKQALQTLRETPNEAPRVAPLTPFTPKRAWNRMSDGLASDPNRPVVFSNLGDVGEVLSALDGTHCEYAFARGTRLGLTRQHLERIGGLLQLLAFRSQPMDKVCFTLLAYQPGAANTKSALRDLVMRTLAEFGLTAEVG